MRLPPVLVVPGLALALAPSLASRPAAPEAARQPGIASAPPAPTEGLAALLHDLWLGASVKARLLRSDEVRARDVRVEARAGVVTLSGMVPSLGAQAAAELAAAKLPRVQRVENWIEVVPESRQAAARARDRALERRVRARLAAAEVARQEPLDVGVCNGVVRLRGRVAGPNERQTLLETAGATAGVREVVDQLSLEGVPSAP